MLIEILLEVLYVLTYQVGRSLYVMLDKLPLCTPVLGVVPDLRNTKSAYSLTGRGLSSLSKKEHHETQRSRNGAATGIGILKYVYPVNLVMQCMEPELGFFLRFGMLTPSAASGRLSELLGFPISCPFPLSTLVLN
jgi:hypothetical protein